jgi:hypothetical protein
VAVHRKHHAFTDTERDPHSPLVHGFWKIQLWNVYYYVREARNPETLARWAKDIRDDVWDRVLFILVDTPTPAHSSSAVLPSVSPTRESLPIGAELRTGSGRIAGALHRLG